MNKQIEFKTTLTKVKIIEILKKHTFHTEFIVPLYLFFGEEYFYGQVNEERIRVGNANRNNRDPSPVFEIFLSQNELFTDVKIQDDTLEKIAVAKTAVLSLSIAIATVLFIIGSVLSYSQPDNFSFFWTVVVCVVIAIFAFLNIYISRIRLVNNREKDLKVLFKLIRR
jgi:hypothetical protein